jgi:hypothetical protein
MHENVISYIFNMDEIALFYSVQWNRTSGLKDKDLTVLLSCNAHGSERA